MKKQVKQLFNIDAPDNFFVEPFSSNKNHPAIPKNNPHYVFRKEILRDVLAFLMHPEGEGLFVSGPTGCGKTSLITQVAYRLHWPVQQVNAHGRLELMDMIGHLSLENGSMLFSEGPLTTAMRHGHLFILNELDLIDPAELAGLNDILEGNPLVLTQKGGEVVHAHPQFRFIATANSQGGGDSTGLYHGVMQQNLAFLDRFRLLTVGYADEEMEYRIISEITPQLPAIIVRNMIGVAQEVRTLFIGNNEQQGQLSLTLSTRTLVRWAKLILQFEGAPNAVEYALERALTFRAAPEQKEAIHRLAADIFGAQWQTDVTVNSPENTATL